MKSIKKTLMTIENKPINQVRVFDVPITDYKCSLNPRGRKRYGKIEDLVFSGSPF